METRYLLYAFVLNIILASESFANSTDVVKNTTVFKERAARVNLFSFKPIGKQLAVGLDFLLPFVKVPLKNKLDENGQQQALVNVNTAAMVTTGMVAAGGMLVGHLFRSLPFGLMGRSDNEASISDEEEKDDDEDGDEDQEEANDKSAEKRFDTGAEKRFTSIFDPFKLVYRNATGERVETSLSSLFATVEETFLDNDIDLAACMQKSICLLVRKAGENVRKGRASGMQKIIDGLSNLSWLMQTMQQSALRGAIEAGKSLGASVDCDSKYPMCKWAAPEEKLQNLLNTYVQFT